MKMLKREKPNTGDLIHSYLAPRIEKGMNHKENALCMNGSYHLFLHEDPKKVTCPKCIEALQKAGKL